ncbi:MAG TPA: hypothetical protein VFK05_35315 [Polyangiaceae bacterium]|nr:hypothetical protein [Polyangiaceae bacterium]
MPISVASAPQYQIHAELDAVPLEVQEDTFDLRSASTLREPLASRKAQPSTDWTPHEVAPPPSSESELRVRSNRSSSPAVTLLVDRARDSVPPLSERTVPRDAVPLSWVLGAALFAVLMALIVAFALRPSAPPQAMTPLDGRASAVAPSTAEAMRRDSTPPSVAPDSKPAAAASAARPLTTAAKTPARAASAASALSNPSGAVSAVPPAPAPPDPNPKVHQAIY